MSVQSMVLFRVEWMKNYQGLEVIHKPTFGNVRAGSEPHESFNFRVEDDGLCYGYARISKGNNINIERLGDVDQDKECNEYVDNVTVIWTARRPEGGMVVVGWYKHARIFRSEQTYSETVRRPFKNGEKATFQIIANAGNVFFLDIPKREQARSLLDGLGKTWKQARPFYISEKSKFAKMERNLWKMVLGKSGKAISKRSKKPPLDQARKKEIEEGAIKYVVKKFKQRGYSVESREDENVGYDLEAVSKNGEKVLCIEVKGRGIEDITADFTINEYKAIRSHQEDCFNIGEYIICIVTNVGRPNMTLYEFHCDRKRKAWFDDNHKLKLYPEKRVAVRYSAKRG